jgi:hypothetical protein
MVAANESSALTGLQIRDVLHAIRDDWKLLWTFIAAAATFVVALATLLASIVIPVVQWHHDDVDGVARDKAAEVERSGAETRLDKLNAETQAALRSMEIRDNELIQALRAIESRSSK